VALLAKEAREQAAAEPENVQVQKAAEHTAALVAVVEERRTIRREQRKDESTVAVVSTEPEAVIQPRKDGAMRPAYKLTAMVHESGFVVGQHVNASSETAAVEPLLEQHQAVFGGANPRTLLGDGLYFNTDVLGKAVENEIDFLCPPGKMFEDTEKQKKSSGKTELYPKTLFRYEEERDVYVCPAGESLTFSTTGAERGLSYRLYRTPACPTCPLRSQCTVSARGRRIKRYTGEEYKEAMRTVFENPRARGMYRRRMAIAEPCFAYLREGLGVRRFRRRGLRRVRAESGLYAMALNLRRALAHPNWLDLFCRAIRAIWSLLCRSTALPVTLSAIHPLARV
jgi:hypothetical protein